MIEYFWAKMMKKMVGRAIKGCNIHPTSKVEAGSELKNVSMGRHSFCGYRCQLVNCEIGSFCSIANDVVIGGGQHPMEWVSTSPVFYMGRDSVKTKFASHQRQPHRITKIGHDVWIGSNAIVKQGIEIGTGAIIGMGAVVTKSVPPYTIIGGIPASKIRSRFSQDVAEQLLRSEWWNLPDKDLQRVAEYICEPERFLEELAK